MEGAEEDSGDGREKKLLPLGMEIITSLLAFTGTKKYTEEGYKQFVSFANWVRPETFKKVPSVGKVQTSIRESARAYAFVKTQVMQFPVDFRKSGAKAGVGRFHSDELAPVVVVKPSDWAKRDLATHSISKIICGGSWVENRPIETRPCFWTIEDAPIVKNRDATVNEFLLPNDTGGNSILEEGLPLSLKLVGSGSLMRAASRAGFVPECDVVNGVVTLNGKIQSISVSKVRDANLNET